MVQSNSVTEIKAHVVNSFDEDSSCELEYFELVDPDTLESIDAIDENQSITACIAAYVEGVRLIDNLVFIP